MRLLFQGDLTLPTAVVVSLAIAVAVGVYYRRETRRLDPPFSWLLPSLRAAAIFLTLMMLAGPVVQRRTVIGNIPRLDVFVDASDSMLVTDAEGETAEDAGAAATRLQRASKLLLGETPQGRRLERLAGTHHVVLHVLEADSARTVWDSTDDEPLPEVLTQSTAAGIRRTNLADPIAVTVFGDASGRPERDSAQSPDASGQPPDASGQPGGPRRAALLLSDGVHNSGSPPAETAARLGDASIPLYAIGIGSPLEPKDAAILDVNAPANVAVGGRASGSILIKDLAGRGETVRLRILSGDRTVWQQTILSEDRAMRRIPFDFSVADALDRTRRRDTVGIERSRVTLPLRATIDPIDGEYDVSNNEAAFRIGAGLRQRRLLIVDSRTRWEIRYLRNLFDRDPTWEVETILAWPPLPGGRSRRYLMEGTFPDDAQSMAQYDCVIWGDVGPEAFDEDQLRRVRDFVSQGGALIFIDGDRDGLLALESSPLDTLLPVRLRREPLLSGVRQVIPTDVGDRQPALRLGAASPVGEPAAEEDAAIWQRLPPPSTVRNAEVLPGAEVWLQAIRAAADPPAPVLVTRMFGGGQVVYLASDQSWRWRYRVADRYHARFWNQLLEAVMQPPFEVRDQYVALTTGAPQYTTGESVPIRARLRDAEGRPVSDSLVEALVRRGDGSVRTVLLQSTDPDRGLYEGRTEPLEPGEYEVSLMAAGFQASRDVKTSVLVVPPPDRETARLARDEDTPARMADASGGLYAAEEEAERVFEAIRLLSDGRVETRRLDLSQSYLWFLIVLGLLAGEWWLRKRAGVV